MCGCGESVCSRARACVCACVCVPWVCVRACVRWVCVRACVRWVCVCVHVDHFQFTSLLLRREIDLKSRIGLTNDYVY